MINWRRNKRGGSTAIMPSGGFGTTIRIGGRVGAEGGGASHAGATTAARYWWQFCPSRRGGGHCSQWSIEVGERLVPSPPPHRGREEWKSVQDQKGITVQITC